MKKSFRLVAVLAFAATFMSGCVLYTNRTDTDDNAQTEEPETGTNEKVSAERKEIMSGKVFEEAVGTFHYSDGGLTEGMHLYYKDYGKMIRIDRQNGDFVIITPDSVFKGNKDRKTYRSASNEDGKYYYSDLSMVFPVEWFRYEKFGKDMENGTNKNEGNETVAQKECISFTNSADTYKAAGYKRILVYKKENGSVKVNATRYHPACSTTFAPPTDCKRESGSVSYSEKF